MLNNVSMNLEGHTSYLHGQVLNTSHCPVGSAIGPFHLSDVLDVQGYFEEFDKVLPDDDYL